MKENQKKILKGYIILFVGFILSLSSILFIIIYTNVLQNHLGSVPIILFLIFIFLGILLITISPCYNIMLMHNFNFFIHPAISTGSTKWFIQGVPNNSFNEFNLNFNQIKNLEELIIKEVDKGIYISKINNREIKFDMVGWLRKRYYIYEYLMTIIQINSNRNIVKKNIFLDKENLKIIFIQKNGQKKQKKLINKYRSCLSLLFKCRVRKKHKIISFYKQNKRYDINDYYNFN